MTPKTILAATALLALVGSALTPLPHPSPEPVGPGTWGIGINPLEAASAPAPFLEDENDLHMLALFLQDDGAGLLETCGSPESFRAVVRDLERGFYTYALEGLYDGCVQLHREEVRQEARRSIQDGTEREDYERYKADAIAMLQREQDLLHQSMHAANSVEAQILATLMERHRWHAASIYVTSNHTFNGYLEYGRDADLINAFLNLLLPVHDMEITPWVLQTYPWATDAECGPHDLEALKSRMLTKMDRLITLGAMHAEAGDEQFITTLHGAALNVAAPYVRFFAENDWWPGLLAWENRIDWDIAYWENYTTRPLPTAEESMHLIDAYRNHTRSILTEKRLAPFMDRLESGFPWDEQLATHVLTLPAMKWTFGADNILCRPVEVPVESLPS